MTYDERLKFWYCDFSIKLSLCQDNYDKIDNPPILDVDFFKTISNIKWSKNAKKLNYDVIRECWIIVTIDISRDIARPFNVSIEYLTRCYALSNNHKRILEDDLCLVINF